MTAGENVNCEVQGPMKSAQEFAAAVNALTGEVAFDLPLLTLPGPSSLQVVCALSYSSAIDDTVQHWNLTHPTGVAGLGWSLSRSAIHTIRPLGASSGETEYLLVHNGAATRIFYASETGGGTQIWTATAQPFWRIEYTPANETWCVTDENGTIYSFGGIKGTEYAVAIGDWLASTNLTTGQGRVAETWNLTSIQDLFSNTCAFEYTYVSETLDAAGLSYTQATYLKSITGPWGDKIQFTYADKGSDEYAAPYTSPAAPNAYQARFETKALTSVALVPGDLGSALVTVNLSYDTSFKGGQGSGTDFTKRLLTGVELDYASGQTLPPLNFTYVANKDSPVKPGALETVTTLEGSVVSYSYATAGGATGVLQYSQRDHAVSPPTVTGVTFGSPRFLFEQEFVVVSWIGSDNSLVVQPYRWQGRWLAGPVTTIASAVTSGYDGIQFASSPSVFGVYAGGKLYPFAPDANTPDGWLTVAAGLSVQVPAGNESVSVAAGDRFLAVLCQPSGDLFRSDFSSLAWTSLTQVSTGLSSGTYSLSAQTNKILLATSSTTSLTVWMSVRGVDETWSATTRNQSVSVAEVLDVSVHIGTGCALIAVGGQTGPYNGLSGYAVAFSSDGSLGALSSLGSLSGLLASTPLQACGVTVRLGPLVWRFDGRTWIEANLGTLFGATYDSAQVAQDMACATIEAGGSKSFYLAAFDANSGAWAQKATAASPGTGVGTAVAPNTPYSPSRYAVLSDSLYYMNSDLSWSAVSGGMPDSLSATDAPSVRILNEDYLIYQTTGPDSTTTTVAFLGNGGVFGSTVSTTGALLVTDEVDDYLIGDHAFVTYTGTWDGSGFALTLHRPVAGEISDQCSAVAVSSVSTSSGLTSDAVTVPGGQYSGSIELNSDTVTTYVFDATAAVASPDGRFGLYNHVTLYAGSDSAAAGLGGSSDLYQFNGLASTETPVVAPPSDGASTNAAEAPSVLSGRTYLTQQTETGGSVVQQSTSYWWGTVAGSTNGFTAYSRERKTVDLLDGVAQTVSRAFDSDTGLPTAVDTDNVDGAGNTVTTSAAMTYFWQHYDTSRTLNILSPVIETIISATTTPQGGGSPTTDTISSNVVTWNNSWPSSASGWAPAVTYRMTDASAAAFDAWTPGSTPPTGWQTVAQVKDYSIAGQVTEATDIMGNTSVYLTDQLDRITTASAANADQNSFSYFGFEVYESTNGWVPLGAGGLNSHIIDTDAHTGSRSFQIPANSPNGLIGRSFAPADLNADYVFSCWARTPIAFEAGPQTASAEISVYWKENGDQKSAALTTLTLSGTDTGWEYRQTLFNINSALSGKTPDTGSVYAFIVLNNTNTDQAILIDELRLSPLKATFSAGVYDTERWLPLAAIDSNGQSISTIFGSTLEPVATIGPDNEIVSAQFAGLSRQLPITGGDFSSGTPNTTLALLPGGTTQYDDFHGDTLSADWTVTAANGGAWSIASGKLSYTGGATGSGVGGTASPKNANTANFAVRIQVAPADGASPAIGDGTVFLRWDASANSGAGGYTLVSLSDNTLTVLQEAPATVALGSEWTFTAIDGFYTCLVNGVPLFAYDSGSVPSTGGLTLAVDTAADFDELIRMDDPRMSLSFSDARGLPLQAVSFLGRNSSGAFQLQNEGGFADGLGRPVISRLPVTADLVLQSGTGTTPPELPSGAPDQYLDAPDGTVQTVKNYIENGVALTGSQTQLSYSSTVFEQSLLGRPVSVLPSRDAVDSSGTGYLTSIAYSGVSALATATPDTDSPVVYRKAEVTRQIGQHSSSPVSVKTGEIRDLDGRLLQRYAGPSSAPTTLVEAITYDAAGRVCTRTQANALTPPSGTTAATWTESNSYDFLGRLTQKTTPDGGVTKYAYDSADRLRFVMTSEGAAAQSGGSTVQRIEYLRYDVLGRPVERGWIQDASYQWDSSALLAQINSQEFPKVTGGGGTGATATGRWRSLLTYDSDGTTTTENLIGRIWKSQTQQDTGTAGVVENITYDGRGRVLSTSKTVGANAEVTTGYSYTPGGEIGSITYPELDSQSFSVGYYYDRLGRLAGIGNATGDREIIDPSQPVDWVQARYAAYSYGYEGSLSSLAIDRPQSSTAPTFTRDFTYDADSRLTGIADPYLDLSLNYTASDQTEYSDGRVGKSVAEYLFSEKWATPPTPLEYDYAYDSVGRLTDAASSLTAAFGFAADGAAAYDPNGNRLAWNRGATGYTAAYPTTDAGAPGTPANGYSSLTPSVSAPADFDSASGNTAGEWVWESVNGGPSTSVLSTTDPHSGSQCLQLGGGNALGHAEQLLLDTYLSPDASLTLTVYTKPDTGYSGTPGDQARWVLTLFGPSGPIAEKTLQTVPAGTTWQQQTVSVDVATVRSSLGLGGNVTRAQLSLVNATRATGSASSGPAVFVDDLSLTLVSPTTWSPSYDQNGNMTSLPQNDLSVTFDTVLRRADSVTVTGGDSVNWLYDGGGQAAQETETSDGSTVATLTSYYDLTGNLIAREETRNSTTTVNYFVNGPSGMVATEQNGQLIYTLTDNQGSIRALVDGTNYDAVGSFDYQPFGGLSRVSGDYPALAQFTSHRIDPVTGLVTTPARLYDPDTGRFLQIDPRRDGLSPYAYVQNDPINLVDPDGEFPHQNLRFAFMGAVNAVALSFSLKQISDTWDRFKEDWVDVGWTMLASAIGVLVPYVAVRSLTPLNRATSGVLYAAGRIFHDWGGLVGNWGPLPRWVPIVSFIRQAGSLFIQKEIAGYAYRMLSGNWSPQVRNQTGSEKAAGYLAPYLGQTFAGPDYNTAYLLVSEGLVRHAGTPLSIHENRNGLDLPVFFPANFNPAFDEHASSFHWVWPWSLEGNGNLRGDVLTVGEFHGHHLTYDNLRAAQQTLQHDMAVDFAMVVNRNAHTTRYGGPAHTGSSAFIRRGYALRCAAYSLGANWFQLVHSWSYDDPYTLQLYRHMFPDEG